ncbi:MAG: hypothetical protein SVZ03_07375, partial [Spirochaetota bacterium]|nr:hypothetical protein [Spirochaetota bacterium]
MNRFIIKRLILMTMLTLFADQSLLYALDTTEVFSLGPVTDFEAYYGYDWDNDNKYPSGEFLIGGGITERFSYLIRGVLSQEIHEEGDTIRIFGGVGFGFIWTVKEKENMFAFDMLPAFTFVPNDIADNEKSAKPNFKGFSYGVSIEVNLTMISMLQPYLLAGYTNYNNTAETGDDEFDDDPYEAPLTFGTM